MTITQQEDLGCLEEQLFETLRVIDFCDLEVALAALKENNPQHATLMSSRTLEGQQYRSAIGRALMTAIEGAIKFQEEMRIQGELLEVVQAS